MDTASDQTDSDNTEQPGNEPWFCHVAAATVLKYALMLTAAYLVGRWLSDAFLSG